MNSNLYHLAVSRDDLGRISSKTETIPGTPTTTKTYSYLNDSSVDIGRITGDGTTTWKYDDNGNRTYVGASHTGYYDDQDRLTQYNGVTYSNHVNGYRTAVGSTTYGYDPFGNLKVVHLPNNKTVTYEIDGAGRRVGRTFNNNGTFENRKYLLAEGNRVVAEYTGSGTLTSQFVYATGRHVPDLMIQGGNIYRFVTDQLGSVRLVVNVANGSIAQQINYDTWGNATITIGTTFDQPFGFAGGLWDQETGLVHFGARDYDPITGRWMQKDPILFRGGDTNLYAYAGGDPVNRVDPDGKIGIQIGVQGGAGIGAFVMGLFGEVGGGLYIDTDSGTLSFYGSKGWLTPTTPGLFGGISGGIEPDFGFYWDGPKFYGDGHEAAVSLGGPFSGNLEITDKGDLNGVCWTPGKPFTGVGEAVGVYPTEVTPLLTIP